MYITKRRKIKFEESEEKLSFKRKNKGIMLQQQLYVINSLNPEEKNTNKVTLSKRIYRCMREFNLSIRRLTLVNRLINKNRFNVVR